MSETRRDFIKKGAIAGGLVWAAPVLQAVPAHAISVVGSPVPCRCSAHATGLRVVIPPLSFDNSFGVGGTCGTGPCCVAAVDTGPIVFGSPPHTVQVTAHAVCGTVNGCDASATVADVTITLDGNVIEATVLNSFAHAQCNPCGTTGGSSVATLTINESAITIGTCNFAVPSPPAGAIITVNEETCTGDVLSVNALHVTLDGLLEIIVAHSDAAATGCPCVICT